MATFKLRNQHFLRAGERYHLRLRDDCELVFPPDVTGKLEVQRVSFGGQFRDVWIEARENVYFDPEDLVLTPDDVEFQIYRSELENFLEYRANLAEEYEEL